MHSLKNTIVAVGLLGLSFVFYQMSAPEDSNFVELTVPEVTDLSAGLAEMTPADKFPLPALKGSLQLDSGKPIVSPATISAPAHDLRVELPSPKITNPLTPLKPNLTQPSLTPPKSSLSTEPEFKPRPEAKFDFTGKSAQPNARQRDQGLITALKSQSSNTNGSQSKSQVPAQSASFVRDSAVVAASKVESLRLDVARPAGPAKLAPAQNDPYANLTFQEVWPAVETLVAEKRFRKSLQLLSRFYRSPELSGPQSQRLDGWLDALATKVVFSNEHHLAPAYISQPGDSLLELGREWGVPGELIYNINRSKLANPMDIPPGTELKKITGPINATVSLDSNTMTLFVNDLYAGRFLVSVGTSGSPRPGDFKVVGKLPNGHDWKDASGAYPPGHPNNHYGKNWIALEGSLCLHAVAANTANGHRGCIGLSDKDASDVFSILSEGSTVSIR